MIALNTMLLNARDRRNETGVMKALGFPDRAIFLLNVSEGVVVCTIGGVAGAIVYDGWDGVTYTTGSLPVGTYPICAKRVRATGTTATVLTGWL